MDDLRLHAVVARVVAWHNRHPLARRITAAQVNSVGYVALPYAAPAPAAPPTPTPPTPAADPFLDPAPDPGPEPETGPAGADSRGAADPPATDPTAAAAKPVSSLRARAAAGEGDAASLPGVAPAAAPPAVTSAPGAPRRLVCSEDFMAPVPVKRVLDWVRTHGVALPREPGDGPVHQVPVDAALLPAGAGVAQLWVATAAIELGGQRHRLLLGGGAEPAVLGRRAWSRPRLLGAFAVPAVLVAALGWWLWPQAPAAVAPPVTVLAAAGAVAPAAAASAPQAPASAAWADIEAPGAPARIARLPALLDDAGKAQARAAVAALRAERQASAAVPTAAATGAAVAPPPDVRPAAPASPAAQPAPAPAVVFGLSTRLLRTRAEAELLQSAFQFLLGGTAGPALRVEMLPTGEDWRVVCWPYERRADAERARAVLLARGLRVELVDF